MRDILGRRVYKASAQFNILISAMTLLHATPTSLGSIELDSLVLGRVPWWCESPTVPCFLNAVGNMTHVSVVGLTSRWSQAE